MKKLIRTIGTISLATILFAGAAPTLADDDTNPLTDPSFERGVPPEDGGWGVFGPGGINDFLARRGRQSMFNGGFSEGDFGEVSGSFQSIPARPGSRWRLTGYGQTPITLIGVPVFGIVQFSFFDAGGNDIGTVETAGQQFPAKTSNEVNGQSDIGEWIFLDTGIATAPEGAVEIRAFTLFVNFSGNGFFQGVFFDDLDLCEVEEEDDDEIECREFDDDDDDDDDD